MAYAQAKPAMTGSALTFGDLLGDLALQRMSGAHELPIAAVCYDSRQAVPGSLFVALRGGYTDGHEHLADARSRGAVAALVESWSPEVEQFAAAAQVDDTRAALAQVALRFYRRPGDSLGVVGVTGTDGKTTTTFLLDAILRQAGLRTGMIGTVSVRIGDVITDHDTRQTTPESLEIQHLLAEMRAAAVDWAILEATSHGLALHRLDTCPFDIGIVTNITHEHLDFHGSIEAYRRAKARLLEAVDAGADRRYPRGIVLNADDAGALAIEAYAGSQPVLRFSVQRPDADIVGRDIVVDSSGTRFTLQIDQRQAPVHLKLIGDYNVANALAAAGAAYIAGIDLATIADGLEALESVPGRLARVDEGQPFNVFVDYAHTPDSLEQTMALLRSLHAGRLIVVFGSAGERDRAKRPVQGAVAAKLADFSVFTSEDPRFEDPDAIIAEIARGALDAGAREGVDFVRCEDRQEAVVTAIRAARPGDVVLLAGKGHEQCIIYGAERRPWDEARAARMALGSLDRPPVNGMRAE
ncbi:MAG TPA: UDP-N-acetylmuramoyl-L-alanyl-D-glutamate--2,6-diaminopimelate ligase [Nitrolancea sp.]|nr:UDP-N-acetylmuramoyl-L-alanyl-D-glutamate--2,6-diaminopimelate ligase [Nitrolancea sp.]